jgi:hypothetical protein
MLVAETAYIAVGVKRKALGSAYILLEQTQR